MELYFFLLFLVGFTILTVFLFLHVKYRDPVIMVHLTLKWAKWIYPSSQPVANFLMRKTSTKFRAWWLLIASSALFSIIFSLVVSGYLVVAPDFIVTFFLYWNCIRKADSVDYTDEKEASFFIYDAMAECFLWAFWSAGWMLFSLATMDSMDAMRNMVTALLSLMTLSFCILPKPDKDQKKVLVPITTGSGS